MFYNGTYIGGGGMDPYAVGNKVYGGGRPMPNIGPVDPMGYAQRDLMAQARRNAILQRLKAGAQGDYASAAYNRSIY